MIGRHRPPETPDEAQQRLARLTAAVDQVLTHVEQAMRTHRANRQLVDLALDVQLELTKGLRP